MDLSLVLIATVSLSASALSLFSGFGLGTFLMPVFLLFFPPEAAIALTAAVHFLNNALKFLLLGKDADWGIVRRFGIPALFAAWVGAKVLLWLERVPPLYQYEFVGRSAEVTPIKAAVALVILLFVALESLPAFGRLAVPPKYLPLGGFLSGFFGGLSGHQGALRSAFLIKCGLSKQKFIATGVVIACAVDLSRSLVYWGHLRRADLSGLAAAMGVSVIAAFMGVYIGSRLVAKVTLKAVQATVSGMLILIAALLGAGLI